MSSPPKQSPARERIASEDPDTAAARKELRQTAISETPDLSSATRQTGPNSTFSKTENSGPDKASSREQTPQREASTESTKEQIASPKKKRQHAEVDHSSDPQDTGGDSKAAGTTVPGHGAQSATATQSAGGEPERKRPRDTSSDPKNGENNTSGDTTKDGGKPSSMTGAADKAKITSASAFNSSGMASYATQASPFLQAGTSASPSPFASAAATSGGSVFGSAAPSLSNTSTVSPFGGIVGLNSPFGGVSASPFGGVTGTKLSSFAQPGTSLTAPKKPAKPFGAPDSESDDDDDGDDSPEDDAAGDANGNDDGKGETDGDRNDGATAAAFGDSKGPKLQRVVIEDGEEHEATLLQIRAKLYYLDKASGSVWKERGAGNLKINVPIECVETEEATGSVYPNTFDASALADSRAKNARLIMRQDSTHRVILNTAIIPALTFKEFSDLKATRIIFTAYEPEGAVSVTIKASAANAKLFLNEVRKVQREIQAHEVA